MRGAMAGALKKKLGLEITSEKAEGRGRVYAIPNAVRFIGRRFLLRQMDCRKEFHRQAGAHHLAPKGNIMVKATLRTGASPCFDVDG